MTGGEIAARRAEQVPIVGRLAPSPTGGLHVGHARTFLIAWLLARSAHGRVVLRMEDLDSGRVRPGMDAEALVDLKWLGLDWDEGPDRGGPSAPYLQSLRLGLYSEVLERLKQAELVYPCTCTRSDIQRAASAPHLGEEGPIYPGTCSGRSAKDAEGLGGRRYCWRFRVPDHPVAWDDVIRGRVEFYPPSVVGDFLVGRSDGTPSYQLAVVVDDAMMGITQVIRGDDLVSSTPRQMLLYEALALEPPSFGHVPLVIDDEGLRLAKRDRSIKLATLRAQGCRPETLIRWIARSVGIMESPASNPRDLIGRIDPRQIPIDPPVFGEKFVLRAEPS